MAIRDFEVTLKLRNNQLKSRRLKLGLKPREIAERAGVSYETYLSLESIRESPVSKRTSTWKAGVLRLADFFYCTPEELFPQSILAVQKSTTTAEFDLEQLPLAVLANTPGQLPSPEEATYASEAKSALGEAIDTLDPRERTVITMRFGIGDGRDRTLDEVATVLGVSRERVRQMETKILAKLKAELALYDTNIYEAVEALKTKIQHHLNEAYRHEARVTTLNRSTNFWITEIDRHRRNLESQFSTKRCRKGVRETMESAKRHMGEADLHRVTITNLERSIDTL